MPKQTSSKAATGKVKSKPDTTYAKGKTKNKNRFKSSPSSSPEIIEHESEMAKAGRRFFATALQKKNENWDEKMRLELAEQGIVCTPSPPSKKTKVSSPLLTKKIHNKDQPKQSITSLEDLQASSPLRPSSPPSSYRTSQAGPGPSSTRNIASRNYPSPTKNAKDRSSSAIPDRFSESPPPPPLGMTGFRKLTGLDAIKKSLRRPPPISIPTSEIEFMDAGRESLETKLKRKESEREETEIRSAGQRFFDEMKNRPKPAAVPIPYVYMR
jgi:hypothetical protein